MSEPFPIPLAPVYASYRETTNAVVAATTLLLYDILLTLGDEIELIWKSPNTPPKFLFFISRYFGLFVQIIFVSNVFPYYCVPQTYFRMGCLYVLQWSAEFSLMIRIYALWDRKRWVKYLLISLFIAEQVCMVVTVNVTVAKGNPDLARFPDGWPMKGCTHIAPVWNITGGAWISLLAFHAIMFTMSAYKCLPSETYSGTPLLVRIIRDGTIYFFLMLATAVFHLVSNYVPELNFAVINAFLNVTFSITGAHLMLNVRGLVAERQRKYMGTDISVSMPKFATVRSTQAGVESDPSSLNTSTCKSDDLENSYPTFSHGQVSEVPIKTEPPNVDELGRSEITPTVTFEFPPRRSSMDRNELAETAAGQSSGEGDETGRRRPPGLISQRDMSWWEEWGTMA